MSLSNLSPVEVDTLYLARLQRLYSAQERVERATSRLFYTVAKRVYVDGHQFFVHPDSEVSRDRRATIEECRKHAVTIADLHALREQGHESCNGYAQRFFDEFAAAEAEYGEAKTATEEVEAEYESRPWPRYWLVASSNGHIHSGTRCCTCNKGREPTRFALVPYLSGQSSEAAVADLGPALCSVCYPDAPVEDREQATIPASVALALREQGCEAFKEAREKAQRLAGERSAKRCPGSGSEGSTCPVCGYRTFAGAYGSRGRTTRVRAHNRPTFYVYREADYAGRRYWTGADWGPSTRKVAFEDRAAAEAVLNQHGGTRVERA